MNKTIRYGIVSTLWAAIIFLNGCGGGAPGSRTTDTAAPQASKNDSSFSFPTVASILINADIAESSGLVASARTPGIYWTHNDSGNAPILYALNAKGESCGQWRVSDAVARDWEDIAPVQIDGNPGLLIADTGDNQKQRNAYELVLVLEPEVIAKANTTEHQLNVVRRIPFTYQDGPHDCEAVAVQGDKIYLATKSTDWHAPLYVLPLHSIEGKPNIAIPVGSVNVMAPTGMDISQNGGRAIVVNYQAAYEFERGPGETWAQAFRHKPVTIPLPAMKQTEAVCYSQSGNAILLSSEGRHAPLVEITLRGHRPVNRHLLKQEGQRQFDQALTEPPLPQVPPMHK